MNKMQVRALMHELMDENPFAIRAVLKILSVEFTEAVPTLAVTNEPQPRLLINLAFINQHCRTEEHVKALLCHEFLHVLLRHTDERGTPTKARHLAVDAVINAIIHRQLGEKYSSLMSTYYCERQGPHATAATDGRCRDRPLPQPRAPGQPARAFVVACLGRDVRRQAAGRRHRTTRPRSVATREWRGQRSRRG